MKNKTLFNYIIATVLLSIFIPENALAYVGPGTGLSAIGAFLALIVGVFVTILGFLWYPVKRLLGRKKLKKPGPAENKEE